MNFKNMLPPVLMILVLGFIQIMFLKNLAIFGMAFCFLYLLGILNLPVVIPPITLLLISFGLGLTIDVFYDTLGMNAAATTFVGFLRPYWLKIISPTGGYDDSNVPAISEMGIGWYVSYSLPLILAFSLVFFSADQWGSGTTYGVISKSVLSSIFSVILIIIVQLLFFERKNKIR
jgi:hypothetical protein